MIVLFNVKITDTRIGYPYARASWYPVSNRFDIFKYALASHAVLAPVTDKFIFYIDLAEFAPRQAELEAYMLSIFPAEKLEIVWRRIDYTHEWRAECDRLFADDDQVIWYSGNDDHIFIDSGVDVVRAGIQALKNDPDPLAIMYYSHWTSQMRMALHYNGELTEDKNFVKYHWENFDSIHMMKVARFKRYWFDSDCGNNVIYRSDDLGHRFGLKLPSTIYAPTKELVRHYDGDSHVGNLLNIAPSMYIPPGFLDGTMKVRIGFNDHLEGWTNLNPAAEWLYGFSPNGADFRWTSEDIPLCWIDKIEVVDTAPTYDVAQMRQARDAAFLAMTHLPITTFGITFDHQGFPAEWFSNHLLAK